MFRIYIAYAAILARAPFLVPARETGCFGSKMATSVVKLMKDAEPEISKFWVTSAKCLLVRIGAHRHLRTLVQPRFAQFKLKAAGGRSRRTVQVDPPTRQDNLGLLAIGPGAPSRSIAD